MFLFSTPHRFSTPSRINYDDDDDEYMEDRDLRRWWWSHSPIHSYLGRVNYKHPKLDMQNDYYKVIKSLVSHVVFQYLTPLNSSDPDLCVV